MKRTPVARVATLGLIFLGATACGRVPGPTVAGLVEAPAPGPGALRMTYLGTGGWIMEYAGEQVLTGPLFTNPPFVTTGLGRIVSDTVVVDRHMTRYDVADARVILTGHAHYDHLMDVPRVARVHAPRARILGSRTVRNTLGSWSGLADRVDLAEDAAGAEEAPGRWIQYGPRIRVMPLVSMHGPHFDGLGLYHGSLMAPLERPPLRAGEWLDGPTFAFLVDFLDGSGGVAFRVYYQDAVADAPLAFAPEALIRERPVDVAVLVPATFEEVRWHPEALVANLRPRRVLLGHWEDFFRPMDAPAVPVPLTDLAEFERRLARVHDGPSWRPERFTEFRFGPATSTSDERAGPR